MPRMTADTFHATDTRTNDPSDEEPVPFTTSKDVADANPEIQLVTPEEMKFLKEWSWGPDAYRQTCENCGDVIVLERHPGDWPNFPGAPGEVRVAIECPACGVRQFTDGAEPREFLSMMNERITAEVQAEVARRMARETGVEVHVEQVSGSDGGDAAAHATQVAASDGATSTE